MTDFGKLLRCLRVVSGETQTDMASKLGISHAMLSCIENGTRRPRADFFEKLAQEYKLSGSERRAFNEAFLDARGVKANIDLSAVSKDDADLIMLLYKRVDELDESSKGIIKSIIDI